MKQNKKLLTIALTVAMSLSAAVTSYAAIPGYGEEYQNQPAQYYTQSFSDVPTSHWAFDYIEEMVQREILNGYPNGNFYPNNTITRAEFSKVMCLAAGLNVSPVTSTSYADVKPTDWFAPYVETGRYYLSGYVSDGQNYYMPNTNALREDIAVALVKLKGYDTSVYDESILKTMFKDYQSISAGARKYVAVAVEQGLISGYEDDTFRGQNTITRAEAATLLWRAYQYGNANKVFEKEELEIPEVTTTPSHQPTVEIQKPEPTYTVTPWAKMSAENVTVNYGENPVIEVIIEANDEDVAYSGVCSVDDIDIEYVDNFTLVTFEDISSGSNYKIKYYYEVDDLEAGRHDYTLKSFDELASCSVRIRVEEPEPEYTYEVKTIANNVSDIRSMVATNDGVYYLDNNTDKVYFVAKNGSTKETVLRADDIEYLGEKELTKTEKFGIKTKIYAIGINNYNGHIYCLIEPAKKSL